MFDVASLTGGGGGGGGRGGRRNKRSQFGLLFLVLFLERNVDDSCCSTLLLRIFMNADDVPSVCSQTGC